MTPLSSTGDSSSERVIKTETSGSLIKTSVMKDHCDKVGDKEIENISTEEIPTPYMKRWVILFTFIHVYAVYGIYLAITSAKWQTNLYAYSLVILCGIGITGGAHRLWCHRSYKAKLPLRIFLAFFFTTAFQLSIFHWSRDHRVHHKFTETDADPHNSNRGFFYCHVGWMLRKRHPECLKKLKSVDVSDLLADPVVRFNGKFYYIQAIVCSLVIPTLIPYYFWGETLRNGFFVAGILRFAVVLNTTFLVNSLAHMWGNRPYDVNIRPRENVVISLLTQGEGFHNYHHTFPYDYSTSELGFKFNLTTAFIDLMAWLGLAYDLKSAPRSTIKARKTRTGEGSAAGYKDKVTFAKSS